ncbi:MAG: biotin/lipoyl-containing protein [Acidobacteriota bacterium]
MTAVRLRHGGVTRELLFEKDAVSIDGHRVAFEPRERNGCLAGILIGGREHRVVAARDGDRIFVWCDGEARTFERAVSVRSAAPRETGGDLISPMPGRVRRILVADGQTVSRGDVLLVLEAMKMEHSIRAPRDGSVRLRVREGDLVDAGVELAQVE